MEPLVALALCVSFVVLFVALLYVTTAGRGPRDGDAAIKARFYSVAATCVVCGAVVAAVLPGRSTSFVAAVGLVPPPGGAAAALLPVLATVVLFLGPLVQAWDDADAEWMSVSRAA